MVVTMISIGLFYLQFTSRYNFDVSQLSHKFEERVLNLESMMKAAIDHVNAMQIAAQSYFVHNSQPSPSLLFYQFEAVYEQKYYALDNVKAPFNQDMVGNLTGMGLLKNRSADFYREIEMALSLNPLFQTAIHNIPNVAWAYYTSANKFINIYPWVASQDFKFGEELYTHEFYWQALPENNPNRQRFWSSAYIDEAGKGLMVTCAAPVYDGDEFRGTVALDFTLDILNTYVKNFANQSNILFVVDQKNQLLAHPTQVSSKDKAVKMADMVFPKPIRSHIEQLFQSSPMKIMDIDSYIFIYQNLQNVPWKLVLWIPKQDIVFDSIYESSWGFLVLLPGLALMLVITTRLTRKEFIIPAELLVKYIEEENKGIDSPIPTVPTGWHTWFETVFKMFKENRKFFLELQASHAALDKTNLELSKINTAYSHFVPHQFLQLLNKKSIIDVQLGNHVQREMTILFSDIRDFTSLSEKMTPDENFNFINSYLGQMEPVISQNHGFIDKYIGDGIMALFPNADDAVHGAIVMLKTLSEYNKKLQEAGYKPIKIGIGLNTGLSMLGTIGGQNRMDGTVISDAVNLASRVEQLTKVYGTPLLISEYTYDKLADPSQYLMRVIDAAKVKGKSEEVTVYEVFDADMPDIIALKNKTLSSFKEGFVLYHCEQFNDALPFFEKVLQINPIDKVAPVYLERCQKILSMTIPDKQKILIVDDFPNNLKVLSKFLGINQFEVLVAKDGKTALEIVEFSSPHLILLDVMMPTMTGFEVCRRLKANPKTKDIPIIFITSLSETEDKVKGFELGAVDYITKPFQQEEVLARVKTHLHLNHLQRQAYWFIKMANYE